MIRATRTARKTKSRNGTAPVEEIPARPLTSDSDAVLQRLERIATHYEMLDQMLSELESRLPAESAPDPATHTAPPHPR